MPVVTPPAGPARWLESLAIRRMGWSEPHVRGVARDVQGKREAYRIVAPARVLLRPRKRAFDVLVVEPWARFGNAVVQIVNVVEGARRLGARRVLLPRGHDIFTVPIEIGRIALGYGDEAAVGPGRTALVGRFFHGRAIGSRASTRARRDDAAGYVRDMIRPEILAPDPRVAPDDVVAHLRSGDVFRPAARGVATYGQPPTAHYLAAIAATGARRVWVVYEDRANPSIGALVDGLSARGVEVIEQSATLAEDLRLLLSARRLVIGRSTLGDAVAALSRALTELYVFGRQRRILPTASTVAQYRTQDTSGDYIAAVQSRNWENTEAQRRLMVEYPQEALRIVRDDPVDLRPPAGSGPTA